MKKKSAQPDRRIEREFARKFNARLVAGVDEAGRGPLAGPVVAAAVILPIRWRQPKALNDSKQIPKKIREALFDEIQSCVLTYGIGMASPEEIDAINILEATRLAARRAIEKLSPQPQCLVTDFLKLPWEQRPILALAKADATCSSVAAASILAKVKRDRFMAKLAEFSPQYGWDRNQGYGTKEHLEALDRFGPTAFHRLSFRGIGFFLNERPPSPPFVVLEREIVRSGKNENEILRLEARIQDTLPYLTKDEAGELAGLIHQKRTEFRSPL